MQAVDHIIHAKWLITCEAGPETLQNHTLVLQGDRIKDILPSQEATQCYQAKNIVHYNHHAVFPGLVNGHSHLGTTFFRGLADDLALMDWLNHYIWPAEKKWLSHEFVKDASLFAIAEMIRSGTTCFNDMFFFMPATAEAIEMAGVRGHVGLHFISFANPWGNNFEEEFTKGLAFYERYQNHPLVTPTLAPHALYTVADEAALLKVLALAEKWNLKINMHVQETTHEIEIIQKQTGLRPIQRLKQLGFLTPRLLAIHVLHLTPADLEDLVEGQPSIVHCPQSNMKLASGACPVTQLLQAGLNVMLGTDGAASNNDLNMLGEMRTAAFLAKHETKNPQSLPASTVLNMATIHGAKGLQMDHLIGSLVVGKAADFIAIDLEQIETMPVYSPISQIVYAASRQQITDVWVAGKQLLKNRKLMTLDEEAILEKARYWGEKINESVN